MVLKLGGEAPVEGPKVTTGVCSKAKYNLLVLVLLTKHGQIYKSTNG